MAYAGTGTSLGGTSVAGGAVNKDATDGRPEVDESNPTTNLQIRFHNGERATLKLNMTHTVGDIHSFVFAAAPVEGEYRLVTGFPPKPLDNESLTLADAKLLNETIVQSTA